MKFSVKTGPNYDDLKSAIEKISQTGKRWRYLHQTDFASRIPGSHKNTQFGGVLWGQFAFANVRTEQPGRGKTDHAYNSDTHQPRAGRQFLLAYQNQWWSLFQHTPRQSQNHAYNSNKKRGCCPSRLHPLINYLDLYLSISNRILNSCSCSSGVFAERNS